MTRDEKGKIQATFHQLDLQEQIDTEKKTVKVGEFSGITQAQPHPIPSPRLTTGESRKQGKGKDCSFPQSARDYPAQCFLLKNVHRNIPFRDVPWWRSG